MVCNYKWCICTFVVLLSTITAKKHHANRTVLCNTIVVSPSGKGDFTTIQAAIDSIPPNNDRWIRIKIKKGVYREKVRIPQDKPYIYLRGHGTKHTVLEWNDHGSIDTSATFTSLAHHTIARGIRFVNSHNSPPDTNRNPLEKAVAALIQGDKSAFYNCRFMGLQDTLWDVSGRHYFKGCTIEGAIDFIFGAGQSLYESCTLSVAAGALHGSLGYITAQGRDNPDDANGFVFKDCKIGGTGKTYLGRPWRGYARVVFYNTQMSGVIVPLGWYAWKSAGKEEDLTLSEYNSHGVGATSSERVKWAKKLSKEEVKQLASMSFIDDEGWVDEALDIFGA